MKKKIKNKIFVFICLFSLLLGSFFGCIGVRADALEYPYWQLGRDATQNMGSYFEFIANTYIENYNERLDFLSGGGVTLSLSFHGTFTEPYSLPYGELTTKSYYFFNSIEYTKVQDKYYIELVLDSSIPDEIVKRPIYVRDRYIENPYYIMVQDLPLVLPSNVSLYDFLDYIGINVQEIPLEQKTLYDLIGAVAIIPITYLEHLFTINILGVNLFSVFISIISILIIVFVVKKLVK